ncbi:MAG TPA: hypothetical protein VMH61_00100 [Candidatus Acidoferrales bacterium]|nr:hypothetical protein [Candidatus Acidoferrales bacterium]
MDERFLDEARREPRPEFARDLRARLRRIEADEPPRRPVFAPVLAAATAALVAAALFVIPSLRVSAQAVLDLFRVREVTVVQVDADFVQRLRDRHIDPQTLMGGQVTKLESPGPDRVFTAIGAAAAAAGFTPQQAAVLPRGLAPDTVRVHGGERTRVVIDTHPLRQLMDAFAINDLTVPAGVDGRDAELHLAPVVIQHFRGRGDAQAALIESASPEVSLPPGVDLQRFGEIGLRLLGIPADDARRLSRSIDWSSTLVVPVIASATSFQQVTVSGARGVYLETTGGDAHATGERAHRAGAAVLWTRDGRVHALVGSLDRASMLQMAESVR